MENELENKHRNPDLPFIINGKEYKWEHRYITGAEIKKLGEIPEEDELFLKIKEPYDEKIIKDHEKIDLALPGLDHFFSKKPVITIIVNANPEQWHEKMISYDQVVKFAFPDYNPNNPNIVYTVKYLRGPDKNPEGSMAKGDSVYVKNKMIFNVSKTDKS